MDNRVASQQEGSVPRVCVLSLCPLLVGSLWVLWLPRLPRLNGDSKLLTGVNVSCMSAL